MPTLAVGRLLSKLELVSPAELQDPAKLQQTLDLLEKAAGNQWIFWLMTGLSNIGPSLCGLRSLRVN